MLDSPVVLKNLKGGTTSFFTVPGTGICNNIVDRVIKLVSVIWVNMKVRDFILFLKYNNVSLKDILNRNYSLSKKRYKKIVVGNLLINEQKPLLYYSQLTPIKYAHSFSGTEAIKIIQPV